MTDKRIEQAIDQNLFGLQVTEGEMQQIIARAYAGDRPRRQLRLVLVTALIILLLAATALAVIQMSRVFVSDGASDMVPHGGRLILYKWREGLFEVNPETGEESALTLKDPAAWHAIPDINLLQDEGQLFALSYQQQAITPFGIQNGRVTLGSPIPLAGLKDQYPSSAALSEGILGILQEGRLQLYPLDGSPSRSLDLPGVRQIIPYGAGRYAGLMEERVQGTPESRLVVIDRDSGDIQVLASLDPGLRVSRLAHIPGSPLVFEANNALFACDERGQVRQAASLVRGDVYAMHMLDERRVAVASDSLILLRHIGPGDAQNKLTVLDPLGRGEDYKDFILKHPDIELSFPLFAGEDTKDRFLKDLQAQSPEVDIYLLRDQNLMAMIKEKGYALNLAEDQALAAFGQELYPPFQAFFSQDAGLYGIPKKAFLPCLAYNQEAFATLGLKVPATWTAFFELLHDWLTNLKDRHPEYTLMPFQYDNTLEVLLTKYLDEQAAKGRALRVNTPAMKELLKRYKAARAADPGEKSRSGQTHLFHLVDLPYKGTGFTALPLSFEPDSRPVLSFPQDSFSYFVVNPYSKNREAALQFLRSYVASMPPNIRLLLTPSVDSPIENPEYAGQRQAYESRLQGLQEQLKTAAGAEKNQLEEQVKNTRRLIADLAAYNRYLVSPRDIADYKTFSGMVYLSPMNPMPDLIASHPEMFREFDSKPDDDVETFLIRLQGMLETRMKDKTR